MNPFASWKSHLEEQAKTKEVEQIDEIDRGIEHILDQHRKMNEEVEQIDEKSAQAFRNKIDKNVRDVVLGARAIRDSGLDMNPEDTGHKTKYQMNKAAGRALRKEKSEQVDETWSKDQLAAIHAMHDKMSKSVGIDPSKKYGTIITKKKAFDPTDIAAGPWKDSPETITDKSGAKHDPMSRAKDLARRAAAKKRLGEEAEQIDEIFADQGSGSTAKDSAAWEKRRNAVEKMLAKKKHAAASRAPNSVPPTFVSKSRFELTRAQKSLNIIPEEVEQIDETLARQEWDAHLASVTASHRKAGNKVIDINASKQHYTVVAPDGRATKTNFTPSGVKHETLGYITPGDSADADVVPAEKNPRGRPTGSKSGTLWNKKTTK